MRIATVQYTGRVRNQTKRGPTGERYQFGGSKEASIGSLEDARHFENAPNFEVSYTARGQLMEMVSGEIEDVEAAISELDYNVKRSLASKLGLETDGSEESALEEALADQAERLQMQMERQR